MSEDVGSFLPDIQKVSLEATVQRLVDLRKATDRVQRCTYDSVREFLAAISVVMTLLVLYMRVNLAMKRAGDKPPPIEEMEIPQGDSDISSLASPNVPEVENNTAGVLSKAGRPKGTTNAHKKEI